MENVKIKLLERLEELSLLENGWLDGEGIAPSELSINNIRKFLDLYVDPDMRLYPILEHEASGITIENIINSDLKYDIDFYDDGSIEIITFDVDSLFNVYDFPNFNSEFIQYIKNIQS